MTNWRKRIALKQFLTEDETDETVRTCATKFVERLKQQDEYQTDIRLEGIVSEFEEISDGSATSQGRYTLCRWFNDVLNELYDWADYEHVWIE